MLNTDLFKKILNQKAVEVTPYITFDNDDKVYPKYDIKKYLGRTVILTSCDDYIESITLRKVKGGVTAVRCFMNLSTKVMKLKELGFLIDGINFDGDRADDYFYSVENSRIYETYTFPVDYNRTADDVDAGEYDVRANNRWADPGVVSERINDSPYQPFPAILLSNYKKTNGLVHGSLSQDVFSHSYLVKHTDKGVSLDISSSFKAIAYREVKSGEVLVDEWYLGITARADDMNNMFSEYTDQLRIALSDNWGAKNICRNTLSWGSWNDGMYRDVEESALLEEAKVVNKLFPLVKWFQLDDGYANVHGNYRPEIACHGIGVPYEGDDCIDAKKFPNGMRAYVDKVKELGHRPAVWIGGYAPKNTDLYEEHKDDWLLDYSYRLKTAQPYDFSVAEAREYVQKSLDTFLVDWGYEGVKLDFWSYQFETSGDFMRGKEKSGFEWREWFAKEIRKRLPSDGYVQACCDVCQGNPFIGKYFNNYRYGIDVSSGKWDLIRTTMLWGVACTATQTGDLYIPNSDSVSLFPDLSDLDFKYWTNYVLITRSMVEVAGRYTDMSKVNKDRLKILQKATCNVNNGQNVYLAKYDYRKPGKDLPSIMYIKTGHFTTEVGKSLPVRTVGLFNADEEDKVVSFKASDLGLKDARYTLTDVWTGEVVEMSDEYTTTLKPHESKLLSVNKTCGATVLDADVKLEKVKGCGKQITFTVPYEKAGEVTFNKAIKSVEVLGDGSATIDNNKLKVDNKLATYKVKF